MLVLVLVLVLVYHDDNDEWDPKAHGMMMIPITIDLYTKGSLRWRLQEHNPVSVAGWEAGRCRYNHLPHPQWQQKQQLPSLKRWLHHQDELDEQLAQRWRRAARDFRKHQVSHRLAGGRHELLLHWRRQPGALCVLPTKIYLGEIVYK